MDSLRECTFPVLKKIEGEHGSVVWKKDTLWKQEVCDGITLSESWKMRNVRSAEFTYLRSELMKLSNSGPYWPEDSARPINVIEYFFDREYCENFDAVNCFTMAAPKKDPIISFLHPEYKHSWLGLLIEWYGGNCEDSVAIEEPQEVLLKNIFNLDAFKIEIPENRWKYKGKYTIEVRMREPEYHEPHFHVRCGEYSASFRLSDGTLIQNTDADWRSQMNGDVNEYYQSNKADLWSVWERLHGKSI